MIGCAWVLILVFVSSPLFGGELSTQVQKAYRELASLRADFVQKTHVEILDKEIEERGTLLIAKPNRFLIHYKGERERKYLSDGKTLWIVHPRERQVEEISNLEEILSREALSFLGGLGDLKKEFTIEKEDPKKGELILAPRGKASPFKKIVLKIDSQEGLAREVILFPKSGNRSHYFFSGIRKGGSVADREFRP